MELEMNIPATAVSTLRQVNDVLDNAGTLTALGCAEAVLGMKGDRHSLDAAVLALKGAARRMQMSGSPVPPEMWNNLGVILYGIGDRRSAQLSLACALQPFVVGCVHGATLNGKHAQLANIWPVEFGTALNAFHSTDRVSTLATIFTNMVYLHAVDGGIDSAQQLGFSVLTMIPFHSRCRLILACLAGIADTTTACNLMKHLVTPFSGSFGEPQDAGMQNKDTSLCLLPVDIVSVAASFNHAGAFDDFDVGNVAFDYAARMAQAHWLLCQYKYSNTKSGLLSQLCSLSRKILASTVACIIVICGATNDTGPQDRPPSLSSGGPESRCGPT